MKRFWTALCVALTLLVAVPVARSTPGADLLLFAAKALGLGQYINGGVAGNCLQVSATSTLAQGGCNSVGAQLKTAYQAATAAGNYIDNPPWFACVSGNNANLLLVCSAWQASTAYGQGAVVSNGGHLYVASVAGTSASSGGPTGQTNVAQTDGSVTWYYFGECDG